MTEKTTKMLSVSRQRFEPLTAPYKATTFGPVVFVITCYIVKSILVRKSTFETQSEGL